MTHLRGRTMVATIASAGLLASACYLQRAIAGMVCCAVTSHASYRGRGVAREVAFWRFLSSALR
jgi:hypothetical protein